MDLNEVDTFLHPERLRVNHLKALSKEELAERDDLAEKIEKYETWLFELYLERFDPATQADIIDGATQVPPGDIRKTPSYIYGDSRDSELLAESLHIVIKPAHQTRDGDGLSALVTFSDKESVYSIRFRASDTRYNRASELRRTRKMPFRYYRIGPRGDAQESMRPVPEWETSEMASIDEVRDYVGSLEILMRATNYPNLDIEAEGDIA